MNNEKPEICDLNCEACTRKICTGAAALRRESK